MSENIQRSRGRPENYRLDRGGIPAESGPFIGRVMSNVDPTRSGRLRVYIEAFADGGDLTDDSTWTTVSYLPPYYGATPSFSTIEGGGSYPGNRNSYGMWFTPPDVGIDVICIFVNGDRSQGYYIGAIPDPTVNHMIPAIGSRSQFISENQVQNAYFAGAPRLPVTEVNDRNSDFVNNPTFYDLPKPVHSVVAATLFQQGLIKDIERGTISSSSQRESPSQAFGISTPGRPVYQGGFKQEDIPQLVNSDGIQPQDARVIARRGGHTLVMDDGAVDGTDQLMRLRTASGHQILLSDSGEFMYFIHANGQSWIELGKEGTVDVYSTNSVNFRTQGDINLHADRNINMYAGSAINMKSAGNVTVEASVNTTIIGVADLALYSDQRIGMRSDGTLALDAKSTGGFNSQAGLIFRGNTIDLNGPPAPKVDRPLFFADRQFPDTSFNPSAGWEAKTNQLISIVTRAPTHEPYPAHNQGVKIDVEFGGSPTPPPDSAVIPAGVSLTAGG